MEIVDLVQKLIAPSLNNPSREEAMSAALKAVNLIVENGITLGGKPAMGHQAAAAKAWAPDAEFDAFWQKMQTPTDSEYNENNPDPMAGSGLKVATVDTDLDDDFMRKRITWAWRAIRAERSKLEKEIWWQEQQRCVKYPHAKDWVPDED